MKKIRIGLSVAVLCGLCCWSNSASAVAGLSTSFKITQLIPREMGLDIVTNVAVTSPANCRTDAFRLSSSASNYTVIASSLITAFSTGKALKVWVTQCDTDNVGLVVAAWVDA
jgi:hypothetical protein